MLCAPKAPLCKGLCSAQRIKISMITGGNHTIVSLSAKLTEGLLYCSIDILTNSTEISADFVVWDTNDSQTVRLQKSGAVCIFFNISILIVLRTVQFNDEFCFRAIEISDIFSQHLLSGKTDRVGTQKIIPQVPFFFCHFFSQLFRQRNQLLIVLRLHDNPSVTASAVPPPFTQGRLWYRAKTQIAQYTLYQFHLLIVSLDFLLKQYERNFNPCENSHSRLLWLLTVLRTPAFSRGL